ncbi:hypothetical protein KSP40_PGU008914 [Platanthera guangdongensis]|uniref:Uncharacterized protein n=1 Tax=Platanthera guangdongensis TaxID=2320717 RepID=A0ABR2N018_9ASPA
MAKPVPGWFPLHKRKQLLLLFVVISIPILAFLTIRSSLYSGDCRREDSVFSVAVDRPRILGSEGNAVKNPLVFMSSKVVFLVSHELSLSVSSENLLNVVVCPEKGCIHRSRDNEFEVGRRDFLLPFRSSRIPNDGQVPGEDEVVSLPTMRGLDHTHSGDNSGKGWGKKQEEEIEI